MKKGFLIYVLCALSLLILPASALAQPVAGCARGTEVSDLVYTAERILMVNAGDYQEVINFWSEDTTYKEAVVTNDGREEMYAYLDNIFAWSSDMELVIGDKMYGFDPGTGDFIYTATNVWSGTWDGYTPYVQEGMSIVKFRAGEGCAYYQRDYFTEGDTWIGIAPVSSLIATMREEYLKIVEKDDECYDWDNDGHGKYLTAGCPAGTLETGQRDCNDYDPDAYPGAPEIKGDGIDSNCNGADACGTMIFQGEPTTGLVLANLAVYLIPMGLILGLRRRMK